MTVSPYHSFYASKRFRETWDRFLKLVKREGKNASVILRDFVTQYVDIHDPGNPQARITSYSEDGDISMSQFEGRVRELFRARAADGNPVLFKDIVFRCRDHIADSKSALAMAERVEAWLRGRGVRAWR